jgi:hypothetical protein
VLANESAMVRGFLIYHGCDGDSQALDSNVVMPTMSNELLIRRVKRRELGAKNKTR